MNNVILMYILYYIGWDTINFRQRHPVSNKQSVALGPSIDCWIGWISMQKLVELAACLKDHNQDNHGDYDNLDDQDNSSARDDNYEHDDQDNLDNHDNSGAKDNNGD